VGPPTRIHVIYGSVATQTFTPTQLSELLLHARAANERRGLTGMLLYSESDGSFFQVLEGESATIDVLYRGLLVDKRRTRVTLTVREPIPRRSFGSWSMGFSSVTPEKLRKIAGLNDFFTKGSCLAELDAGKAKKLLAAFAEGRWRAKHLDAKRSKGGES
jgi:hypothetical protein